MVLQFMREFDAPFLDGRRKLLDGLLADQDQAQTSC